MDLAKYERGEVVVEMKASRKMGGWLRRGEGSSLRAVAAHIRMIILTGAMPLGTLGNFLANYHPCLFRIAALGLPCLCSTCSRSSVQLSLSDIVCSHACLCPHILRHPWPRGVQIPISIGQNISIFWSVSEVSHAQTL